MEITTTRKLFIPRPVKIKAEQQGERATAQVEETALNIRELISKLTSKFEQRKIRQNAPNLRQISEFVNSTLHLYCGDVLFSASISVTMFIFRYKRRLGNFNYLFRKSYLQFNNTLRISSQCINLHAEYISGTIARISICDNIQALSLSEPREDQLYATSFGDLINISIAKCVVFIADFRFENKI